jgi:hypothetical protein
MRKSFTIIAFLLLIPGGFVKAQLRNLIKTTKTTNTTIPASEIVKGLKTALLVGTDSSVSITSKLNGFYKDEAIKILLPPEAQKIYANKNNALFRAAGLDNKLEDAVIAINRAAEDAAKEAGPIFKNAITGMSINDGYTILKGKNPALSSQLVTFDSTAATGYLRSTTYSQLKEAFAPKINISLNKALVGKYSPNQIWNTLTTSYNSVAKKSMGFIEPVAITNLGEYVTQKTLDGLFYKVAIQEKVIRRNPGKWAKTAVGNILQRVFGNQT